jgi:hypothetical protein
MGKSKIYQRRNQKIYKKRKIRKKNDIIKFIRNHDIQTWIKYGQF